MDEQPNIGRMDVLVIGTLGMLASAVEAAAGLNAGTLQKLVAPSIEKFARKHFPRKDGNE